MDKILILDFGSQYTQLIARRVREMHVYSELHSHDMSEADIKAFNPKGIILSGGPNSVYESDTPIAPQIVFELGIPVLGICYGMQTMAAQLGGKVENANTREFGYAEIRAHNHSPLLNNIQDKTNPEGHGLLDVWMSHGDTITALPAHAHVIATTESIPVAAFELKSQNPVFGIQFHPEVYHSTEGLPLLKNFAYTICGCAGDWTPGHFIDETVSSIRETVGNDQVILGLSGGVDSSVAALLLHKAIGKQLHCIFIDNGLLRKNEFALVQDAYNQLDLNVIAGTTR